MSALLRKELTISLDWLRPVLVIAFVAFTLAPFSVPWLGEQVFGRTWTTGELFDDLSGAALLSTPLIAAIAAFLHATGDDRHGAGTLIRVLPILRWRVVGVRLFIALFVGLGVSMLMVCTAWALSTVSGDAGTALLIDSWPKRIESMRWSLAAGVVALGAVWGSTALHPRPMIGAIVGVIAGKCVVFLSGWLVLEVLDTRYEIPPDAKMTSVMPLIPATALVLFAIGTAGMLGVRRRRSWMLGGALAASIVVAAPAYAYWRFVRPAIPNGWIRYTEAEILSNSPWYFAEHLDAPEPGYNRSAAWNAYFHKIAGFSAAQHIEFTDNLLWVIEGKPERAISEARNLAPHQAVYALDPLVTGQPRAFERLEQMLEADPLPTRWLMIVGVLAERGYLRPSAADAIERAAARAPDADSRDHALRLAASIRGRIAHFEQQIRSSMPPR